jgi:hypothetical protein
MVEVFNAAWKERAAPDANFVLLDLPVGAQHSGSHRGGGAGGMPMPRGAPVAFGDARKSGVFAPRRADVSRAKASAPSTGGGFLTRMFASSSTSARHSDARIMEAAAPTAAPDGMMAMAADVDAIEAIEEEVDDACAERGVARMSLSAPAAPAASAKDMAMELAAAVPAPAAAVRGVATASLVRGAHERERRVQRRPDEQRHALCQHVRQAQGGGV